MNTQTFIETAPRRLAGAPVEKKIVLYYAGILTGLSVLIMLVNVLLGLQINKTGGLGAMGFRSVLSTLQTLLPILQTMVVMCLGVGYQAAMLRIARGQYTSPQTLRLGFARFWVLLRSTILQGLVYFAIATVSTYLASLIFAMTPLATPLLEVLAPMLAELDSTLTTPVLDAAALEQLVPLMQPFIWIFLAVFLVLAAPVALRLRMVNFVIIDKPGMGAMAALSESRKMMRGNVLNLLKLDLRLWWFYLATVLSTLLCYADSLLPLLGISLPMSPTTAYYVFYGLYLAAQFAIYYFLYNRVEVAYALAYDEVRPKQEQTAGAVLGNIFRM